MSRFPDPPTVELRREWSRIALERRRDLVRRALEARQGVEASGLGDELRREGVSELLVRWLDDAAAAWDRDFLERHRARFVREALPRTPADYLSGTLVAFIVLMAGLIWTVQEVRVLNSGTFPFGLLPALLVLMLGWIGFRRRLTSLLRLTLRRKGEETGPPSEDA